MFLILSILFFCILLNSESSWIQSTLPITDDGIAVGSYNKSIYLLGGFHNRKQLMQYNISHNTFIHYNNIVTENIWGQASHYTQLGHILYIRAPQSNTISIFDMKTRTFTASYIQNIPTDTYTHSCVTSNSKYLFVTGGWDKASDVVLNIVQMYDLLLNEWINDVPSMNIDRAAHCCIIHPITNTLYVFGGYSADTILSSVETLDIEDIMNKTWTYIDPLPIALGFTQCVIYQDMIFIVGGAYGSDSEGYTTVDTIYTINVFTNEISLLSERMPLDLSNTAPVIVDDILYIFGGYDGALDDALDTWMMYDLMGTQSTQQPITTEEATTTVLHVQTSELGITTTYTETSTTTSETAAAHVQTSSTTLETADVRVQTSESTQSVSSVETSVHTLRLLEKKVTTKTSAILSSNMISTISSKGKERGMHVIPMVVAACIAVVVIIGNVIIGCFLCRKKRKENKQISNMNMINVDAPNVIVVQQNKGIQSSFVQPAISTEGEGDDADADDMHEYQNNPNIGDDEFIIADETVGGTIQ